MANEPSQKRQIGLKAIGEAQAARQRGRGARPTTTAWIVLVSAIVASLIVYKVVADRQLEKRKADLLGKQRAIVSSLGARWFPLRDKVEGLTIDAAKEYRGDFVDGEVARWDFRTLPGIYLRLRMEDARDAASIRKAAEGAQKDGFQGCLLRESNGAAARGEPDAGAFAEQPWNLRQAYAATRVLGDDWANEIKIAEDDLRLRVFEQQLDKAVASEIPIAADVVTRAQFYLLVLDEDDDAARALADGGPVTEEALQLVPHWARVELVNLKTGNEVVRLRRRASASFLPAGERPITDPEERDAVQRQVNNCALANEVRAAMIAKGAPRE